MNSRADMPALPVNLLIQGRPCLVVGGGRVAARKCGSLLAAGAQVRVVSPALCPELVQRVAADGIDWLERPFKVGDVSDAALVFACTDKRSVNRRVLDACRKAKVLCSCVDGNWAQSDFTSPAVTRHGGLTLTVSTGGQSCRRAKLVKTSLARHLESLETADLVVAGTDQRLLTLEQREPFHLAGHRLERVGGLLMQVWGIHEFMLLNTCNRIEILAVASHPTVEAGILCHALGFDRLPRDAWYQLEGRAAWEHSALVCAGMLSQTPGENHVAAQMKDALAAAVRRGWAGGMLQEWMASALHMSKHIKNEVVPDMPVLEIENLALLALQERIGSLRGRTVMIIGSGMVGRGLAEGAMQAGARIVWCYHRNRPEMPPEWADGVALRPLTAIRRHLPSADAVISATESSGFVLQAGHATCFDPGRKVVLIDLGVPRNIDPELARRADAVDLVDIEKLKGRGAAGLEGLRGALDRCRTIVHAHGEQYERLMDSFQGGNA